MCARLRKTLRASSVAIGLALLSSCATTARESRAPSSAFLGSTHPVVRLKRVSRISTAREDGTASVQRRFASRKAFLEAVDQDGLLRRVGVEDTFLGAASSVHGAAFVGDYLAALKPEGDASELVTGFVRKFDPKTRKLSLEIEEPEAETRFAEVPLDELRDIHVMEMQPVLNPVGIKGLDSFPVFNRKAYEDSEIPGLLAEATRELDSRIDRSIWEPAGNESKMGATEVLSASKLMNRVITGIYVDRTAPFTVVRTFGGTVREVKEVGSRHRLRVNGPYGSLLIFVPGASRVHVLSPSSAETSGAEPPYRPGSYGAPTQELLDGILKAIGARKDESYWREVDPSARDQYLGQEVFGLASSVDGVPMARVFRGFVQEARVTSSPGVFEAHVREADGVRKLRFGANTVFGLSILVK